MKPSISRKMDMVKDVFLNNKRMEEHLLSVEDWVLDNHTHVFIDEYFPERQLLTESKSKKKISNYWKKFKSSLIFFFGENKILTKFFTISCKFF